MRQSGTSTSSGAEHENQIHMPTDESLFFMLKGDHPTLPEAEVEAIIEAEGLPYTKRPGATQVFRCQTGAESSAAVARRAYYTRLCAEEVFVSEDEPAAILSALKGVDFNGYLKPGERFRVSLRRVRRNAPDIDLGDLRDRIVRSIQHQTRAELSLERGDVRFIGLFSGGRFYFGRVLTEVGRWLEKRKSKRRPFLHPSTLQPKLAGCMVNLTRARPPEPLLDPFCGAGALLIEAGVLGCRPVGMDLSPSMVEGSRRNLAHFGVGPSDLMVGDARRLSFREVGAVATDPPYGRTASTHGMGVEELYRAFLGEVADQVSAGGCLCVAAPKELHLSDLAKGAGFKHIESHHIPVHGSLTREVAVFRRI